MATDIRYYDNLFAASSNATEKGIVSVVGQGGPDEIDICHLTALWRYSTTQPNPQTGELEQISLGDSFFGDSAAVILAVHHFNNGIGDVVPEISGINESCKARFTLTMMDSKSSISHSVRDISSALHSQKIQEKPCMVLGPFRSAGSQAVSILTSAFGIPQMSPISSSPVLDNQMRHPLFSRTTPSDTGTALLATKYLKGIGVTHCAVIYVNDGYGKAYNDAFVEISKAHGIETRSFSFDFLVDNTQDIQRAVHELVATRFRYFFGIIYGPEHYDIVMEEAFIQKIAGSGYSWLFGNSVERYVQNVQYPKGSNLAKATQGIGIIQAGGGIAGMPGFDALEKSLLELNPETVDYINSKQPKYPPNFYYQAGGDYFQTHRMERVKCFSYDMVIALGLALCHTIEMDRDGEPVTGENILSSLTQTVFRGASGWFRLDPQTTSRDPLSALYVIFNAIPIDDGDKNVSFETRVALTFNPQLNRNKQNGWKTVSNNDFIFSGGSKAPPPVLPPLHENFFFIGDRLRIIGLILCSFVALLSVLCASWVIYNRKHRVVLASQPIFLLMVCLGTIILASTIIPLSIDDQHSSKSACDAACVSAPWLFSIGFTMIFSALFSKLWRVNKIFHHRAFQRVTVKPGDVCLPFLCLFAANAIILVAWSIFAPLQWSRRTDSNSLDIFGRANTSIGSCWEASEQNTPFLIVLFIIQLSAIAFANVQAYHARKVSLEFSEARYIGLAMLSMLQAWIVGVPLVIIANVAGARFIVSAGLVFVTCTSVLLLMFGPKMKLKRKRDIFLSRRSIARSSAVGIQYGNYAVNPVQVGESDDHEPGLRIVRGENVEEIIALREEVDRLATENRNVEIELNRLSQSINM